MEKDKVDSFIIDVIQSINGINDNLYQAIHYIMSSGGKRVRALLLIKLCELLDVDKDEALICATALEMIHNYSLVHDDLPAMDDDDFRRGVPACHKKFGEGIAILAGNGLYTLALQLIADGLRKDIVPDIIRVIITSSGVTGLLSGQAEDISKKNFKITSDQDILSLIDLYYLKTGKLFEAAFLIPCILAKSDNETTRNLAEAGSTFGVLYQLSDDIADGDINEDIAEELKDSLLSRFYKAIDSTNNVTLSIVKSFSRQMLDFQ